MGTQRNKCVFWYIAKRLKTKMKKLLQAQVANTNMTAGELAGARAMLS